MRRCSRRAERCCGEEADIAVLYGLPPGPAVDDLVDVDRFAVQKFGVISECGIAAPAQWHGRRNDAVARRGRIARGFHDPTQMFGGEILAGGRQASVE